MQLRLFSPLSLQTSETSRQHEQRLSSSAAGGWHPAPLRRPDAAFSPLPPFLAARALPAVWTAAQQRSCLLLLTQAKVQLWQQHWLLGLTPTRLTLPATRQLCTRPVAADTWPAWRRSWMQKLTQT